MPHKSYRPANHPVFTLTNPSIAEEDSSQASTPPGLAVRLEFLDFRFAEGLFLHVSAACLCFLTPSTRLSSVPDSDVVPEVSRLLPCCLSNFRVSLAGREDELIKIPRLYQEGG